MDAAWTTVLIVVGSTIVLLTLIDMIRTVLGVSSGHGVVSGIASRAIWRVLLAMHRERRMPRMLRAAGPLIFIVITLTWAAAFIVGWTMIFSPPDALTSLDDGGTVGWLDRVDYGTTMLFGGSSSTVEPNGQPWSFIAGSGTFNGLVLASFGLAYALPAVQSVIRLRTLARSIDVVGRQQDELADASAHDGDDSALHLFLLNLVPLFVQLTQEIHAYPIVPYFHAPRREGAIGPNLVALLDGLGRQDGFTDRLPETLTLPLLKAMDDMLAVIADDFIPSSVELGDRESDPDGWRRSVAEAWTEHAGWSVEESTD